MANMLGIKLGRYILYERSRPMNTCDLITCPNVKIITGADQLKDQSFGIQRETIERLLHNRSDLFVYFENDVPLGMLWGHRGSCYVRGPGIPLLLDDDTVYSFWAYVMPMERGKNIYKKMRCNFYSHYKEVRKFISLVEPTNTIVRSQKIKDGYVEVNKITYIKYSDTSLVIEKFNNTQKVEIHLEKGNRHNLLLI